MKITFSLSFCVVSLLFFSNLFGQNNFSNQNCVFTLNPSDSIFEKSLEKYNYSYIGFIELNQESINSQFFNQKLLTGKDSKLKKTNKAISSLEFETASKKFNSLLVHHKQKVSSSIVGYVNFNTLKTDGYYSRTAYKKTFVEIGIMSLDSMDRINYSFHVLNNKIKANESGGLSSDSLFLFKEQNSKFYTTNLLTSSSIKKLSEIGADLNIRLFDIVLQNKLDSIKKSPDWSLKWCNSIVYTESKYWFESDKKENFYQNHFFDTTSTHDKLVYKPISFTSKLELKNNYSDTKSNFLGFLGYNGILNKVSQNDIDSTYYISNIFWGSGLQYRSKFGLFYIGDFTFLRNPDTYNHFNHSIFLYYSPMSKWRIDGKIESKKQLPSYIENRFYSNNFIWQNRFSLINNKSFDLNASILDSILVIKYSILNLKNYIYFDYSANPRQYNSAININRLALYTNNKLKKFHITNYFIYSSITHTDIYRFPKIILGSRVKFTQHFKNNKIAVSPQLSLNYFSSFHSYSYEPAFGSFYLKDGYRKSGNYPFLDLSFDVKLPNALIELGCSHINNGLSGRNYFLTTGYPSPGRSIYLKIIWTLEN